MKFDEYQKHTARTAKYRVARSKRVLTKNLVYPVLGLVGEAGEVNEKLKRLVRGEIPVVDEETRSALALELGDVLWYVAQCGLRLDMKLSDIARMNIEKLRARKKKGTIHGSGDDR